MSPANRLELQTIFSPLIRAQALHKQEKMYIQESKNISLVVSMDHTKVDDCQRLSARSRSLAPAPPELSFGRPQVRSRRVTNNESSKCN